MTLARVTVARAICRRQVWLGAIGRMKYSSYQPPNSSAGQSDGGGAKSKNAHRAFYSEFGAPIFKVFLGALFTYQALHFGWAKLESLDLQQEKNEEIRKLECQLRELADAKKESGKA